MMMMMMMTMIKKAYCFLFYGMLLDVKGRYIYIHSEWLAEGRYMYMVSEYTYSSVSDYLQIGKFSKFTFVTADEFLFQLM